MSELAPLVQTLFRLQGFEAEANGTHVLRFHRGTERVALRVRETKDTLPAHVATELAETLPLLGHGVLVTLGDVGHEARSVLERGGVDVWTRDKLIHEVGKAMLEAAERGTLRAVLTPGPSSDATLPAEPVAPAAPAPTAATLWAARPAAPAAAPAPAPLLAVPAAPLPPVAQPLTATLVQAVAPAPAPAPPAPALTAEQSGGTIALAIGREDALRIGTGRLLKVEKASLELVPLHAFRYACRLEAKGAPAQAKSGLLAIDAVTGTARELQEPTFGLVTERADKLQAMVADLDAADLVKRKVVELHTQKVRVKNSLGRTAAIVADQWVRPDPRTMQVEPRGTWYLPMWRMEGQNGSIRVNGATGSIEEEKLKRAFAQDAEFL